MEFQAWYNGSETETAELIITWTAHTDGTFTSVSTDDYEHEPNTGITMTDMIKGLELHAAQANPGATAPQALHDITVTDAAGEDLFGGDLTNLSATATESAHTEAGGTDNGRLITGALTINISGNNVNSATGVLKLTFGGSK
jgi:hypothetical protein